MIQTLTQVEGPHNRRLSDQSTVSFGVAAEEVDVEGGGGGGDNGGEPHDGGHGLGGDRGRRCSNLVAVRSAGAPQVHGILINYIAS